jgi:chorismate synthase
MMMPGNSIGRAFVLTSFGESHGVAVGGVIDGFPSNIPIDTAFIQTELDRRRPGKGPGASSRDEDDLIEILSGLFQGRSTGAPIAFLIRNNDARSADYDHLKDVFRPSHADLTWHLKYGIRDPRGGGRASARETAVRVAAGAFAKLWLAMAGITIVATVDQIGTFIPGKSGATDDDLTTYLNEIQAAGDTVGGIISCVVKGVPPGLGEPVFGKLQADLGGAMLGINAAKGFEYGSGFAAASMRGSEHNDPIRFENGVYHTVTNHAGGILGGISNGEEIIFRVAFKPVATLMQEQETVNAAGERVVLEGKGRHDVCVVPRAIPVVEAMAALVVADHLLLSRKI